MKKFLHRLALFCLLAVGISAQGWADSVTFDLTSGKDATDVTTVTQSPIKLTFDKAGGSASPKYYASGTSVRMYASNTLVIANTEGKNITGIKFTFGGTTSAGLTADKGSYTSPNWSGSATQITFTAGAKGQQYIQKIEVTYQSGGTTTEPEQPEQPVTPPGGNGSSNVTFDFSTPTLYCDSKFSFSQGNGTVVDYFSNGNIEVNVTQNGGSSGQELRFYNVKEFRTSANGGKLGHYFVVSTKDGSNITEITFTNSALALTPSVGSLNNGTWTGESNSVKFTTTGAVTISKMDVTYSSTQESNPPATPSITSSGNTVTITCDDDDAEIYYTLDGSDPDTKSNKYSEPFDITSSCTVKAIAYKGDLASEVASQDITYTAPDVQYPQPEEGAAQVVFLREGMTYDGPATKIYIKSNPVPDEGVCELDLNIGNSGLYNNGFNDGNVFTWNKSVTFKPNANVTLTKVYWTNNTDNTDAVKSNIEKIIDQDIHNPYWSGEANSDLVITPPGVNNYLTNYFIVEYKERTTDPTKGTEENPYTVEEIINGISVTNKVWVKGYILGTFKSANSLVTDPSEFSNTNMAIANSVGDNEKYISISLPNNNIRTEVNLQDHPENIGEEIMFYGNYTDAYFGRPGLQNITDYRANFPIKKVVSLSFSQSEYTAELKEGFESPELKVSIAEAKDEVNYSSSEETVATVDINTGAITLKKAGETTITAAISGSENFSDATASYKLIVTEATDPTPGGNSFMDELTTDNLKMNGSGYSMYGFTSDNGTVYRVKGGVNQGLQINTNTSSSNNAYLSGIASITIPDNYVIEKIEAIKSSSGTGAGTLYVEFGNNPCETSDVGTEKTNAWVKAMVSPSQPSFTGEISDNTIIYVPKDKVKYFRLYTDGKAVQLSSLKVYYKPASEPTPVLGELTYTVTGNKKIDDEEITVDLNDVFTFSAENATDIKVMLGDDDPLKEANGKFENGTYTWTISEYYEDEYVTVTPYLNDVAGESLVFLLTVNKPTPVNPNVPAVGSRFKQLLNGDDVKAGNIYVIARYTEDAEGNAGQVAALGTSLNSNSAIVPSFNIEKEATYKVWRPKFFDGVVDEDDSFDADESTSGTKKNLPYRTRSMNVIKTTGEDVLVVKAEEGADGLIGFKTLNWGDGSDDEQGYLYAEEGATAMSISPEFKAAYRNITNLDNISISFAEKSNRTLSYVSGTSGNIYFNYQISGNAVQIYELTNAVQFLPDIETIVVPMDQERDITLNNDPETIPTNLQYKVKGTTSTVIWIEERNGQYVVKANDNRASERPSIMITWEESDGWFSGIKEVPVIVKYQLDDAEFGFRHAYVRGKKDIGVLSQAAYYTGPLEVTYKVYESYNDKDHAQNKTTSEITIDANTGMIRKDDIKDAVIDKEYLVEAYVGECDQHFEGWRTYLLKIEEPGSAEPEASDATFDFTGDNIYGFYDGFDSNNTRTAPGSNYYEGNINLKDESLTPKTTIKEGPVTLNFDGGTYQDNGTKEVHGKFRYWPASNQIRAYAGTTMKFSVPEGYSINSITFDADKNANTALSSTTGTLGTTSWTAPVGGVIEVTFELKASYYINTISIDLSSPSVPTDKPEAGLYFDVSDKDDSDKDVKHYFNFFEDETVKLPKLLHNSGMDGKFADMIANKSLVFDIDEVSNDESAKSDDNVEYVDYTITPTDFDNITVQVSEPGVYTLRASYEGDEYLPGFAILRLNVFPRLKVEPQEDSHLVEDSRYDVPNLTIVSAGQNDDYWNNPVNVKIPSIASLENQYKYSTVKITKVVISELMDDKSDGETTDTYEGENLSNVPESHPFSYDGRITYTITYADTPDFSMEETVHVIHHPYIPNWNKAANENTIIMEPSKHAVLEYAVFNQEDAEWETTPEASRIRKAEKQDDSFYKTLDFTQAENGADVKLEPGQSVVFRSVKDLSNLNLALEDNILASPYLVVNLPKDGTLTEIDGIEAEEFDADALYFNLQGVRVLRPERGIYIKVKGDKSSKVVF